MTGYPLDTMLAIRTRRAEAAIKDLAAAERRMREAVEEQAKLEDELARWRRHMEAETARRWASLLGSLTSTLRLEDFRAGLAELDLREAALMGEIEAARQKISERRQEAEAARQELSVLNRAKEKLERHKEAWLALKDAELDRLESLELEEFTRPAPEPAD